ncbi:MAG: hypothetical protein JSU05_08885 [Bacteroidetes bacterium]|nr:hypothetical protein [Bacteroidota bacterium]
MKTFKIADLSVSILLILFFATAFFSHWNIAPFAGYFIVGGWQVISMLVHFIKGWFIQKGNPKDVYQIIVLITFLIALLGLFITPLLFMLLYFLLVAAPVMAIIYSAICYAEIRSVNLRPLSLLK